MYIYNVPNTSDDDIIVDVVILILMQFIHFDPVLTMVLIVLSGLVLAVVKVVTIFNLVIV